MKKLFTFTTIAMLAVASQAAQINWGDGLGLKNPGGTTMNTAAGNTAGVCAYFVNNDYLVAAGLTQDDLIAMLDGTYAGTESANILDHVASAVTGMDVLSMSGHIQGGSFSFTYTTTIDRNVNNDAQYANTGDTFFMLVVADFGSGEVYQIFGNPLWVSSIAADNDQPLGFSGGTNPAGGWEPVPEPLTVGLALAGVALLIAQRKRK